MVRKGNLVHTWRAGITRLTSLRGIAQIPEEASAEVRLSEEPGAPVLHAETCPELAERIGGGDDAG